MRKVFLIIALTAISISCKKSDTSPLRCMECVDNTGTITCGPFKQTEKWAYDHTTDTKRFSFIDDSNCR